MCGVSLAVLFLKSPPGLRVHGPAAGGPRNVVPCSTSPAGVHKFADLLAPCAIHSSGRIHWAAGQRRAAAGHGGLSQPRGCGTLHCWELLFLPSEWWRWLSQAVLYSRHCLVHRWCWIWTCDYASSVLAFVSAKDFFRGLCFFFLAVGVLVFDCFLKSFPHHFILLKLSWDWFFDIMLARPSLLT